MEGIRKQDISVFEFEAEELEQVHPDIKAKIQAWIEVNCRPVKSNPMSIYGLKHKFQQKIGYVTHGALTFWLNEMGYRVKHSPERINLEGTVNHVVFLRYRPGE